MKKNVSEIITVFGKFYINLIEVTNEISQDISFYIL